MDDDDFADFIDLKMAEQFPEITEFSLGSLSKLSWRCCARTARFSSALATETAVAAALIAAVQGTAVRAFKEEPVILDRLKIRLAERSFVCSLEM